MPKLLFAILHLLVCTLVLSGLLLYLQRAGNKRPRVYLVIFSFVTAAELVYRLYLAYRTGVLTTVHEALPIYVLLMGILEILLMYLYPLEVVKPNWITPKRLFLLFLPWLLVGGVCILIYPTFRDLSSFSQVINYIGEFNVWFRLLILFLCFIPYTIFLLCIPYKWQQNSVDKKWIYKYVIGIQIIGFLFSTVVLTGSVLVSCIHLLYGSLFFLYITYQELYLRLLPIQSISPAESASSVLSSLEQRVPTLQQPTINPLWEKLTLQMDQDELWRNPDLTLEDLSKHLYTNRTTLTALIQHQGYSGYAEFINRRRITAFTEAVNSSNSSNTQQLFYEVGFRSKSTALRNFRLYMGCTPTEYMQQIVEQRNRVSNCAPDSSEKR